MKKVKRVMLIGIDGATWRLLDPWIKEGSLPNFSRIVKTGLSTPLKSTIPPMTPPALISLATGKNPGRHGVFDFYRKVGKQRQPLNSQAIKSKQIWEILSEKGRKVIVINPVLAYPVRRVNGYLIAGMMTPSEEVDYTWPPNLKKRLKKWGYQIGVELDMGMRSNWARSFVMSKDKKKRQILVDFFNRIAERRWETFKKLTKNNNWQFAFIFFEGTDRLQHYYWQKNDLNIIKNHYLCLDRILGECLNLLGKKEALLIFSDHGFGEIKKKFYINNFLLHQGLLKKKSSNWITQWLLGQGKKVTIFLSKLNFPQEKIIRNRLLFKLYFHKLYRPQIEFEKSLAFMFNETSRGIWINSQDDKEYEKTRNLIIKRLNSLRDPENGRKIIKAFKKEEIYQGLYVGDAPDIILVTNPGYSLELTIEEENLVQRAFLKPTSLGERNADHEMDGILMAAGPGIKKIRRRTVKNSPEIIDIAPTILKLLGVHIPIDMDGKAIF